MPNLLIVTGASSGIGAAVARLAPKHGWQRVVVHYGQDRDGAEAVARDVTAAGATALVMQADIADPEAVSGLVRQIAALEPGRVSLVNNAGITAPTASFADLEPERVARVFAVNVFGALEVARQWLMLNRRWASGGDLVNVSSASARLGSPHMYVDYAASKGAVESMTLGLADEVASEGIRVNAIRPGLIETPIHAKGHAPDRLDKIGHTPPMGRPGSAEEVAEAVLWLLSDEASYVTRTILDVTGGR